MRSKIFIALLTLLIVVLTFIALIPAIISSQWGLKHVVGWINESIPGKIEIRSLNLHWGSGQKIEDFTLRDAHDNLILEFETLSTDASLWQILRKSTHLGHIELKDLNASIVTDEKGINNLQYAFGLDSQETNSLPIPPSTILLSNINAELNLFTPQQPLSVKITGETHQDKLGGSFDIRAILPRIETESWLQLTQNAQGLLSFEGSKDVLLQVKIQNFPIDLLDQFLVLKHPEWNGLLRATLGDRLNITIDKQPSQEGLAFILSLLAPRLQGDVKAKIVNNQFSLEAPASFHLKLNPATVQTLSRNQIKLLTDSMLHLTLNKLGIPMGLFLEENHQDLCSFEIDAKLHLDEKTRISLTQAGEIFIQSLQGTVEAPACSDKIHVNVTGQAQQPNGQPFDMNLSSVLGKPKSLNDVYEALRKGSQASIKVNHLPLGMITSLQKHKSLLDKFVGQTASLISTASHVEDNTFNLAFSLQTAKIHIDQARFEINEEIKNTTPIAIEYVPDVAALNSFLEKGTLAFVEATPLSITIPTVRIPLDEADGLIEAVISAPLMKLKHSSSGKLLNLRDLHFTFAGPFSDTVSTKLSTKLSIQNSDGTPYPLLGDPALLTTTANIKLKEKEPTLSNIIGHLESDRIIADLHADLLPQYKLALIQPLKINYKLHPDVVEALSQLPKESYPRLKNVPEVYLVIDPTVLDIKNIQLDNLTLKGNLSIDTLKLQAAKDTQANLEAIDIPWEINSPLNMIRINLKGKANSETYPKPGEFAGQFIMSNWTKENVFDLSSLKVEATTNLIGLPTSLISSFVVKEDLTPLFGSIFDLELQTLIDRNKQTPGYWDMVLDSPHFHIKSRLKFGEAITLYESTSKAAEIRWTLTPEGYKSLTKLLGMRGEDNLALTAPVNVKAFFSDLYVPVENMSSFFTGGKFNLNIETNDIAWNNPAIPAFKVKGQVHSSSLVELIELHLHSTSKEAASLAINGELKNLFTLEGQKNWNNADVKLDLQAVQIPVEMIRSLLRWTPQQGRTFSAVVGPHVDAQLSAKFIQMEGPLEGSLKGENGEASLGGQLKKGTLFLTKPFEWKIQVTPELNSLFLKDNIPIFSSVIASEAPLRLVIEPKGAAMPLMPFDISKISIAKGTLQLGKIRFRNDGELRSLLSLLKPIPENQFTIWFTPIYFQLAQGDLKISRFDYLVANAYSLATWGTINLPSHDMDLTVGLSEQALRTAFGLHGLPSDFILQVPVKGRKGQVEIDKAKAAARISALIAKSHENSKIQILGNVLELAASGFQELSTPPPTTDPLPWQSRMEDTTQKPVESSRQQKPSDAKTDLLEEIGKSASSIIKLFQK